MYQITIPYDVLSQFNRETKWNLAEVDQRRHVHSINQSPLLLLYILCTF